VTGNTDHYIALISVT